MPSGPPKANIVILGASGRVGALVCAAFSQDIPPDYCVWRQHRRAPQVVHPDDFIWDFTKDGEALDRLLDRAGEVHALINLAGVTRATNEKALEDNAALSMACLARAAERGIPHVFLASSAAIYGAPGAGQRLSECANPRPKSGYGAAKLKMERAAADFSNSQGAGRPRVTCLRIGNVAGADELLCNALDASARNPLSLDRFEDGASPVRSYIGPQTLARVLLSLVRASAVKADLPEILNVASPKPVAMAALLEALGREGHEVAFTSTPAPEGAIPEVVLATETLETYHEFAPNDSDPQEMIRQWLACRGAT